MKPIDCRSDEGMLIGFIDSIIYLARILAKNDLDTPNIKEALLDLRDDEAVKLLTNKKLTNGSRNTTEY